MPPPSLARELFERIEGSADRVVLIRSFINSSPPTTEGDHFDTKLLDRDTHRGERKAKEQWSEALGGFANAGGGVLIWGLDARKSEVNGQEVDAVSGELPIPNVHEFASRLRELHRQSTDPPLGNVEIMACPIPEDETKGFVVCFIPEGLHKPYRSEQAGQQFFLRAGDSTPVMPKAVLATMFYPRTMAVFRAQVRLLWLTRDRGSNLGGADALLRGGISLTNVGTATAKDLLVRVTLTGPSLEQVSCNASGYGKADPLSPSVLLVHVTGPLHPAWTKEVAKIDGGLDSNKRQQLERHSDGKATIKLEVACENQEPQTINISVDVDKLIRIGHLDAESAADSEIDVR